MKPPTRDAGSRLVYSTDGGRTCLGCRRPLGECACGGKSAAPAGDGVVRVARETKGRNGKGVTVVSGLALDDTALLRLGKQLKAACGCGGTVKNGVIEVQGDQRERVAEALEKRGWRVKRAGG